MSSIPEHLVRKHMELLRLEADLYRLSHPDLTKEQIESAYALIAEDPRLSFECAMCKVKA